MPYLLKIDVSPFGEQSTSRQLGNAFIEAFSTANPNVEVRLRDLNANPLPHLDIETITANYVPADTRPATQATKHQFRLELIQEIIDAKAVVITVPFWNWSIPSVLKAYLDHILMVGTLDPRGNRKLIGKPVTILVGSGGAYGSDSEHPDWDFVSPYLKHYFTLLGSEDVVVIRSEHTVAGKVPGLEALIPKKEQSLADGITAAKARANVLQL